MPPRRGSFRGLSTGVLAVLLSIVVLACGAVGNSGTGSTDDSNGPVATGSSVAWGIAEAQPAEWAGPVVSVDALPVEAHATLRLFADGGPFPYRQDGSTFQNREALLPDRPSDFYREYTVETPRSPDRGARRLVIGEDRAAYYTEDHYASFRFVAP